MDHNGQQLRIFISHSRKDNDFGVKLGEDLRRNLVDRATVWYDLYVESTMDEVKRNDTAKRLAECEVFIVVLSPNGITSKHVNDEINFALSQKNAPKRIIPVLYQQCKMREDLVTIQNISFLPPKPYTVALKELLVTLTIEDTLSQVKVAERTSKRKERVVLDFSPEVLQRLDDIKVKMNTPTRAEAIRNSLRLYEWFVNETEPDSTIKIYDRDNVLTSSFRARIFR